MMIRATGDLRKVAVRFLADRLKMKPDAVVHDDLWDAFFACKGADLKTARGVILYKNYSSGDIEMVCAGDPGWTTPGIVKASLNYPFEQLDCNRITCLAHRKNKAMRGYLIRMGFKLEGVKRKALNGSDVMIYGLLRSERKWA